MSEQKKIRGTLTFFQQRGHALFIWRVYIRSQILRLSRAAILHPSLFPTVCFMINVLKVLCILPRVHINYRLAKAITLPDPLSRLQAPLHRLLFRLQKCLHIETQFSFFWRTYTTNITHNVCILFLQIMKIDKKYFVFHFLLFEIHVLSLHTIC